MYGIGVSVSVVKDHDDTGYTEEYLRRSKSTYSFARLTALTTSVVTLQQIPTISCMLMALLFHTLTRACVIQ